MAKKKLKEHHINRDWCKGCGICVHFCPKKVLELDAVGQGVGGPSGGLHLPASCASSGVRIWPSKCETEEEAES